MNRYLIALFLLVAGVILVLVPEKLPRLTESFLNKTPPQIESEALLDSFEGTIRYKSSQSYEWVIAKASQPIAIADTLETEESKNAFAIIEFDSGWKIKISSFARVTLEKLNDTEQLLLIFSRGQYEVLTKGVHNTLFISINGKIHEPGEPDKIESDNIIKLRTNKDANTISTNAPSPSATPLQNTGATSHLNENGSLKTDYIKSVIKEKNIEFQRCYSHLLEKSPGASGRISLNFTIQPEGKTVNIQFLSSTLSDPTFTECVRMVLDRTRFLPFKGEPIATTYPLTFKIN